ncbi:SCO family protein [Bacillaceae bacterium W0354]
MSAKWRNILTVGFSILIGMMLIYFGTDGLRAFTAESARIYQLETDKPAFPDVVLEDSLMNTYTFSHFAGKYVFLTFIYTACTDVCPQLEMNLKEVYEKIPNQYIGEDVIFLSISFDIERDHPHQLSKYMSHFDSDGKTWRMARIPNEVELNQLLDKFGVIVIPDGNGGFAHNSAFYLVNREGYLIDVLDYKKTDEAANKLIGVLQDEAGGL